MQRIKILLSVYVLTMSLLPDLSHARPLLPLTELEPAAKELPFLFYTLVSPTGVVEEEALSKPVDPEKAWQKIKDALKKKESLETSELMQIHKDLGLLLVQKLRPDWLKTFTDLSFELASKVNKNEQKKYQYLRHLSWYLRGKKQQAFEQLKKISPQLEPAYAARLLLLEAGAKPQLVKSKAFLAAQDQFTSDPYSELTYLATKYRGLLGLTDSGQRKAAPLSEAKSIGAKLIKITPIANRNLIASFVYQTLQSLSDPKFSLPFNLNPESYLADGAIRERQLIKEDIPQKTKKLVELYQLLAKSYPEHKNRDNWLKRARLLSTSGNVAASQAPGKEDHAALLKKATSSKASLAILLQTLDELNKKVNGDQKNQRLTKVHGQIVQRVAKIYLAKGEFKKGVALINNYLTRKGPRSNRRELLMLGQKLASKAKLNDYVVGFGLAYLKSYQENTPEVRRMVLPVLWKEKAYKKYVELASNHANDPKVSQNERKMVAKNLLRLFENSEKDDKGVKFAQTMLESFPDHIDFKLFKMRMEASQFAKRGQIKKVAQIAKLIKDLPPSKGVSESLGDVKFYLTRFHLDRTKKALAQNKPQLVGQAFEKALHSVQKLCNDQHKTQCQTARKMLLKTKANSLAELEKLDPSPEKKEVLAKLESLNLEGQSE